MKKDDEIKSIKIDCPICNRVHDLEIKSREKTG